MSGSAALEYGFPSTHSTNAVSVALYALLAMNANPDIPPLLRLAGHSLAWVYALSIVFGRLYCGMHGFLDVVVGSALGALLAWIQWAYEPQIDAAIYSGDYMFPLALIATILVLVRIHPEPADPCPCFDDGVAFAAVVGGIDVGQWHFAQTRWALSEPVGATVPYSWQELGLAKSVLRVVLGVAIIFLWRGVMKPTMHRILPPVFRIFERIGLSIPRKDYKSASQYTTVPPLADDTLPRLQDVPALLNNIRRARSDSVGPQSAADAYETLAYREKRRRESLSNGSAGPTSTSSSSSSSVQQGPAPAALQRTQSSYERYEREMGTGAVHVDKDGVVVSREEGGEGAGRGGGGGSRAVVIGAERGGNVQVERDVVRGLGIERPRVRYDVEVVAKLVVYAGIAWWAVEGVPVLFEWVGLGMGVH